MYVRAILNIDDWDERSIDNIKANLLQNWVEEKPEYSVFEIDSINDIETINRIVLRLIIENPKKWRLGFQLLVLENSLLVSLPAIIPDKCKQYNCLHGNIPDVSYDTFKKCVDYTYKNCKNVNNIFYCDYDYIANLLYGLSNEDFSWYIKQKGVSNDKLKSTCGEIKKYYFKYPGKNHPVFIDS